MNKKGFTLVEVLVSVVLVAIVMISMLASLVKIRNTYSNLSQNSDAVLFSSTISRVLNNDVFNNSGIRRYMCSADNMKCDLILGNDQYRVLEIIDSTNTDDGYHAVKEGDKYKLVDASNKNIRELGANIKNNSFRCSLKGNCLSITVDENGNCVCSKEREVTTLKYSDPLNDKILLVRSINLDKNIDPSSGAVLSTDGYQFKYIDSFSRAYHSKMNGNTIADVISIFTIYVYDGLDSNDETYNIHLASSSISNNSALYVGNRYELTLGLGKYEVSLRAKDETNLISDKSGNYIGSIYENFGVGFSSPYGPPITQIGVPYVSDSLPDGSFVSFVGFYDCYDLEPGDINHPEELDGPNICKVDSIASNGKPVKRIIDEFGNILINSNYYHEDKKLTALWGTTRNVDVVLVNDEEGTNTNTIHERYATGWFGLDNSEIKISSVTVPTQQGKTFGGYFSGKDGTGTRYVDPDGSIVGIPNFKYDPDDPTKKYYLYAYWVETTRTITYDENKHVQNYVAPYSGQYQLEVWGAQGGGDKGGGLGSYSTGVVSLSKGQILYVVPGGAGGKNRNYKGGYNGGGGLSNLITDGAGTGGGATHIATTLINTGLLSDYSSSRENVVIAAGGGGGASTKNAGSNAGGYRSNLGGGDSAENEKEYIYAGFKYTKQNIVENGRTVNVKVTDWSGDIRSAGFGSGEQRVTQGGSGAGGGGYYGGVGGFLITKANVPTNFGSGTGGTGSIENDKLYSYTDKAKGISIVKHMYCHGCDSTVRDEKNRLNAQLANTFPPDLVLSNYTTYNDTNINEEIPVDDNPRVKRIVAINSLKQSERTNQSCNGGSSNAPIADCAKKGNGAARVTLIEMNTDTEEGKLTSKSTFYVTLNYTGGVATVDRIYEKYGSGWALNADDKVQLFKISVPLREGYLFGGFYTDTDGKGTECIDENGAILMDPNYVNDNETTLYAYWINASTVLNTVGFHTFIANRSGFYRIELWGAGGGNWSTARKGGNGGYTTGVVELNAGEQLYVYVGGTANGRYGGYNGGGDSVNTSNLGGGGATHVSLVPAPSTPTTIKLGERTYDLTKNPLGATLNNETTKDQVILVAGGGGGQTSQSNDGSIYYGHAGGYTGAGNFGGDEARSTERGLIGIGQSPDDDATQAGAGGGGYYGGQAFDNKGGGGGKQNCGGGGSGFINHDFVIQNTLSVVKHMSCTRCSNSMQIQTMTNTYTEEFVSTPGNLTAEYPMAAGNNGAARITLLQIKSE